MSPSYSNRIELMGREDEISILDKCLSDARDMKGSSIFLTGITGIGKSVLMDHFLESQDTDDIKIIKAYSDISEYKPFNVFSTAFEKYLSEPLFRPKDHVSFSKVFVIDRSGLLLAESSVMMAGDMDADIFAGMLSAVQDFVRNSLDTSLEKKSGIKKMEYGDMSILIENGERIFLTSIYKGTGHPDMERVMKNMIRDIESQHGHIIRSWSGKLQDMEVIQDYVDRLSSIKFKVRQDIEGSDLEMERVRVSDHLLNKLIELSRERTVVLAIDDIHLADESSQFVIDYIARNIRDKNILMLCSVKPDADGGLQELIKGTVDGSRILMPVLELERKYIIEIINNMYPNNEFPDKFIDRICSETEGHPLFLIETLESMIRDNCIIDDGGGAKLVNEDYSPPDSLEAIVFNRLDHLDSNALSMAEFLSCIGQRFDITTTLSLDFIQGHDKIMGELTVSGLIMADDRFGEFARTMFKEVIYNGIDQRWKIKYHKILGEHFEGIYWNELDDTVYEVAHHYLKTLEYSKAFEYSIRGGELAESSFSPKLAINLYESALNSLNHIRAEDVLENRVMLNERLGDNHTIIGNFDDAFAFYSDILKISMSDKQKANAHYKIAIVHEKMGEYEESRKACQKGLDIMNDGMNIETARLKRMLGITYIRTGDYDGSQPIIKDVIDLAVKLDSRIDIAQATHDMGLISWFRGDYDEALASFNEAISVREEIGDIGGRGSSLNNIAVIYMERGENDKALDIFKECLAIDEKREDIHSRAGTLDNIGSIYHTLGDLDLSRQYHEESLEILKRIGDKSGYSWSLGSMAYIFQSLEEYDVAFEYHEKSIELCNEIGDKQLLIHNYYGMADTFIDIGECEKALEYAGLALDLSIELGAKRDEGVCYMIQGMAYRDIGDIEKAEILMEKANVLINEVGDATLLGMLIFEMGILQKIKGNIDEARSELMKAAEIFSKANMNIWTEKTKKALMDMGEGT